jgi:phosphoserine phosphatase
MDAEGVNKLVVADICNTLYDSNTTFDFFRYCVQQKKIRSGTALYKLSVSRKSLLFWTWAVLGRLTGKDYPKMIAVRLFRGLTPAEVHQWALEFYDNWLKHKLIRLTNEILQEFGSAHVVLVSSTIEPVARVIAEKLHIRDFLSTELEIQDGKYTGKILEELTGNKLKALHKKYDGNGFTIDVVLTDNFSDKELMHQSAHKIAVCYNPKQEKFWRTVPGIRILNIPGA